MELIRNIKELGIDTDEALKRFMGDEKLFFRMLAKLPDSINELKIDVEFDESMVDDVINAAHTIKGMTGNLSVIPLYIAYTEIVRLLREGKIEPAKEILRDIIPVQEKILGFIEENIK